MKYNTFLCSIILFYNLRITDGEFLGSEGIVGGFKVENGNVRYQVSLHADGKPICGGGIIGSKFILTAAHCVTNKTNGKVLMRHYTIIVTLNAKRPHPLDRRFNVIKIYLLVIYTGAPIYKIGEVCIEEGDIAVLELEHEIYLSEGSSLTKLELPDKHFSHLHKKFVIAGHGVDKVIYKKSKLNALPEVHKECSGELRYAEADSVPNYDCRKLYSLTLHHSTMCARVKQLDKINSYGICSGDSGSILVYNGNIAVGVSDSASIDCNEAKEPGIYTRVPYYLSFIKDAMEGKKIPGMRIARWSEISYRYIEYVVS